MIVEDEVLIGIVLEDILDMLGCTIAGNAATLAEGEALAAEGGFDIAILDVNLGSEPVFPLADRILATGVPIIFATGSHPESLPPRFSDCAVLEKPYAFASVEAALSGMREAA
ncbi:response regulator [Glacieibacterium sp.]|uniref:response regulator n=1 Tax=Glacieibacterium sp. TaxID=2860237 RepID=UPI003B0063FF